MSESEAGEQLAIEQACKLNELNPEHELLRYFKAGEDTWETIRDEFTTRFGKVGFQGKNCRGELALAYFFAQFYLALKKACEELTLTPA